MTAPDPHRPVPHQPGPRRPIVAGAVALLAAAAVVVVIAVVPSPADTLVSAREQRAVCLVQRDTAVTAEQRQRAVDCVTDMDRVIARLEQPAPAPTPTPVPVVAKFPTEATVGTPAGWTPKATRSGDLRVTVPGTIVEDLRITGSIIIETPRVLVRRVEVLGGNIRLTSVACRGTRTVDDPAVIYPVIEDTTFRKRPVTQAADLPAIEPGGYVARRVEVLDRPEGLRVSGRSNGCGPVTIDRAYLRVVSPDVCGDWHGDGVQGYDGNAVALTNSAIDFIEEGGCGGTAPYFVPHSQGNLTVSIDGLLVKGGGFSFRLGVPGTVKGLRIVDGSWGYGPIDVKCSAVSAWEASIVHVDAAGQVASVVRSQPCSTEGGR